MITVSIRTTDAAPLRFEFKVAGVAYLDNVALSEFAKPSATQRRDRFIAAPEKVNGSLLFSGTSAAELAALKGGSASNFRTFLNAFGAHWVFVGTEPREGDGARGRWERGRRMSLPGNHARLSSRKTELEKAGPIIDMLVATFCQLGAVMGSLFGVPR